MLLSARSPCGLEHSQNPLAAHSYPSLAVASSSLLETGRVLSQEQLGVRKGQGVAEPEGHFAAGRE